MTSERHKQYMREYHKKRYQENKEKFKVINHQNYLKRKANGIIVGDQDIYHTITELKEAEIEEFGAVGNAINWEAWNRVVNTTKEEIKDVLENYQPISKRKPIYVFVINSKEPLMKFETSDQAAEALGIQRMLITNACRSHKPIKNKGIYLSYDKTTN